MIETEYKQILNECEYNRIKRRLELIDMSIKSELHTNYYYDSISYNLNKIGITLRVRQIGKEIYMQCKLPIKGKEGNIRSKKEVEKIINKLPSFIEIEDCEWLNYIPVGVYLLHGTMVTQRFSLNLSEDICVELDRSIYLGNQDYELEIESRNGDQAEIYKTLKYIYGDGTFEILDKINRGKRSRFFSRLSKLDILKNEITVE